MPCETIGRFAIHRSAVSDINTLAFLLQNLYFPNMNDLQSNEYGMEALQKKDTSRNTVAPNPNVNGNGNGMNTNVSVDAFKLLKKYNFNFNIHNQYGKLPINCACFSNNIKLLKWMINNIFNIY